MIVRKNHPRVRAFTFAAAALAALGEGNALTSPSSIKSTTYSASGVVDKIVHKFADGMNRHMQIREELGAEDIVTGVVYDQYYRITKTTLPFMDTFGHVFRGGDPTSFANTYYNGSTAARPASGNKAFTEAFYHPDPLSRVRLQAQAGSAFAARPTKVWNLGLASPEPLPSSSMNDATLDNFTQANSVYHLTVTRDANNQYTQSISDRNGNVVKTWADPTPGADGDEIVAQNIYGEAGDLVYSMPPGEYGPDFGRWTVTRHMATGELSMRMSPDKRTERFVYNRAGQLRFIQDSRDTDESWGQKRFQVVRYDQFGRETERLVFSAYDTNIDYFTEAYANNAAFPTSEGSITPRLVRYYDNTARLIQEQGVKTNIASDLLNLKGRLVAEVLYNEWSEARVMDLYSYDKDGRISNRYKSIPNVPLQSFRYLYDLQDRVTRKIYQTLADDNSVTYQSEWDYTYAGGRLTSVKKDNNQLVGYTQQPTGELSRKQFSKAGAAKGSTNFTYNVRGWLNRVQSLNGSGVEMHREDLSYDAGGTTPRFNGDISKAVEVYRDPPATFTLNYGYDQAGRLKSTSGSGYNESFSYDAAGRLKEKWESGVSSGPYVYASNSNQLQYLQGHPTKGNTNGNYVYDANGNMIFDRSKKMAVYYDWRNMAVMYRFFNTVPTDWIGWDQVLWPPGSAVLMDVTILYDAAGNRVSKESYKY